ncbi:unnamed protein product [Urochloa decumbens]|uniref:Uncharacterized protein n=1 Tax=Urochloa decumbens TaxID=240449 RepID=A0ABC8YK74_9POAL
MDGSWQLWPSNHSCQLNKEELRSMRSKALSCKLLPGVVWLHPWVHAEILSYLHIYKYRLWQMDPHSKSYTCGLCTYLRR